MLLFLWYNKHKSVHIKSSLWNFIYTEKAAQKLWYNAGKRLKVEDLTKDTLWNGREWVADYRRLRAIAHI